MLRHRVVRIALSIAVFLPLAVVGMAHATGGADWPAYLFGSSHGSTSDSSTITAGNAGTLTKAWTFVAAQPTVAGQPQRTFYASPTVVGNQVFIGSNTGVFYAVDLATGKMLWQQFLGFQPKKTCNAIGLVSTASVSIDPTTGREVVYVAGGDGYLYALDAADGSTVWRSVIAIPSSTVSDYFDWSSPTVANGKVYVGFASDCDKPFPPGGVASFDQASGARVATYYTVPGAGDGGGVWTSPVVSPAGDVLVTTGSGPPPPAPQGYMYSIVRLDGATLSQEDAWTVPVGQRSADADFASSPTMFSATDNGVQTDMVAACNKNGVLYAWPSGQLAAGAAWSTRVGIGTGQGEQACLAAPVWDGQHLFYASNPTTISGIAYQGSVRELVPSTGAAAWELGLGGSIEGSPSANASGVIAAATFRAAAGSSNGTYLVQSSDGSIVGFLPTTSLQFSQPVFAGKYLLLANGAGFLTAYTPRVGGDTSPPSVPGSVQAGWDSTGSEIDVTWTAGSDNVGVSSYRVFRNGGMIATVPASTTAFADDEAVPTGTYAYAVEAVDGRGNVSPVSPPTTAAPLTAHPLFSDGFESGTFSKWQTANGMAIEQDTVASGLRAARMSSSGGTKSYAVALVPPEAGVLVQAQFFINSRGANPVNLITIRNATGQMIAMMSLSLTGTLATRTGGGAVFNSRVSLTPDAWHTLVIAVDIGVAGTSSVWLDGNSVAALTRTANYGTDPASQIVLGDIQLGRSYDIDVDNLVVDTDPGPPAG